MFALAACGETEISPPANEGGAPEAALHPDGPGDVVAPPADGGDAGSSKRCSDVSGQSSWLLVAMALQAHGRTELAAFDLVTRQVAGSFQLPGHLGVVTAETDPYVLGQGTDVVHRMKGNQPWVSVGSWNVAGEDDVDGGPAASDPVAVVVPDCKKGYVLRYQRNEILVVDTNASADGPVGTIDLAPLLQAADLDRRVEPTGAVFVPERKRIYVLLGNVDQTTPASSLAVPYCASTKPSIVAIDTETDKVVSLGGAGPGGGILLEGYGPPASGSLVYDPARDRLLVLSRGCVVEGPPTTLDRGRVEEVQLSTGNVRTLLDAKGMRSMLYVDATHAVIQIDQRAHAWNPQESALGGRLPGWFDAISYNGQGNVVGPHYDFSDAGPPHVDIYAVPLASAGTPDGPGDKIGAIAYPGGYVRLTSEVWPKR